MIRLNENNLKISRAKSYSSLQSFRYKNGDLNKNSCPDNSKKITNVIIKQSSIIDELQDRLKLQKASELNLIKANKDVKFQLDQKMAQIKTMFREIKQLKKIKQQYNDQTIVIEHLSTEQKILISESQNYRDQIEAMFSDAGKLNDLRNDVSSMAQTIRELKTKESGMAFKISELNDSNKCFEISLEKQALVFKEKNKEIVAVKEALISLKRELSETKKANQHERRKYKQKVKRYKKRLSEQKPLSETIKLLQREMIKYRQKDEINKTELENLKDLQMRLVAINALHSSFIESGETVESLARRFKHFSQNSFCSFEQFSSEYKAASKKNRDRLKSQFASAKEKFSALRIEFTKMLCFIKTKKGVDYLNLAGSIKAEIEKQSLVKLLAEKEKIIDRKQEEIEEKEHIFEVQISKVMERVSFLEKR